MPIHTIEQKINDFQMALGDKSVNSRTIVRKFILHGAPHCFDGNDHLYFELKDVIAEHFGVHPWSVFMVGSAKIGFSIAPRKLFKHFDQIESDIDVVVVSDLLFDQYWKRLYQFNIDLSVRTVTEDTQYRQFLQYMFKGWMRPDLFPFTFDGREQWFEFFKQVRSSGRFGRHTQITCALFRDNFFFEDYHLRNIDELRKQR